MYLITLNSSKKREAEYLELKKSEFKAKRLAQINNMTESILNFSDLLENLMANKNSSGASIIIPETIMFYDEKPKYYYYFDKHTKEIKGI